MRSRMASLPFVHSIAGVPEGLSSGDLVRKLEVHIYARRLPDWGWRGALVVPSVYGDLISRVEIPPGFLRWLFADSPARIAGWAYPDEIGFWQALIPMVSAAAPAVLSAATGGLAGKSPVPGSPGASGHSGLLSGLLGGGGSSSPGGMLSGLLQGGAGAGAGSAGGALSGLLGALGGGSLGPLANTAAGLLGGSLQSGSPSESALPADSSRVPGTLGGLQLLTQAMWSGAIAPRVADILRTALRGLSTEAARLSGQPGAAEAIDRARQSQETIAAQALGAIDALVTPRR